MNRVFRLLELIGEVDEQLIEASLLKPVKKRRFNLWPYLIAAVLALALIGGGTAYLRWGGNVIHDQSAGKTASGSAIAEEPAEGTAAAEAAAEAARLADEAEKAAALDFVSFVKSDEAKALFEKYYFDTTINFRWGANAHVTSDDYDFAAGLNKLMDVLDQKIKKEKGRPLILTLTENPDIARAVGEKKKKGQTLVGFAAETHQVLENAADKLEKKNLDLIVANDVTKPGAGFAVDTNIASLITVQGIEERPLQSKRALAEDILDKVLALRG